MANIDVMPLDSAPAGQKAIEYVERKGIGHPDTLIDGIAERASMELSKYYLDNFGTILHHNVDKGLIVGGASDVAFGKGKITTPIEVIIAGRAANSFQGAAIPVDDIVIKAARDYLEENTRFLNVENEVVIESKVKKGSANLMQIFSRRSDVPLSNDSSFAVGFAPLTETERLTLEIERFLNGKEMKAKMPAVGEDVKVLCVRNREKITATVAIAFVAPLLESFDDYVSAKEKVTEEINRFSKTITKKEVAVTVNNGDSHEKREVYITKSGLSCESGDDGSVGRGNRVNGLITPMRPMTLEAAAGKNPVSHVGKLYSVLARDIAEDIVNLHKEVKECYVHIAAQIGRRIDDPENISLMLSMHEGKNIDSIRSKAKDIVGSALENIGYLTRELVDGKHSVF